MRAAQLTVFVIAAALTVLAVALIGGDPIAECQRDGHSYAYCYQLLYGVR